MGNGKPDILKVLPGKVVRVVGRGLFYISRLGIRHVSRADS
jgi:hypothetical protein